jgi:hypothetical protein
MKVLVFGNCVTVTFSEVVRAIFPKWDVRRVDMGSAQTWLASGDKPEFTDFLRACDLIVASPMVNWPGLVAALNPVADRIVIPSPIFRGLHPDIAIVPNLKGIFSASQTSLIAVAACSLGLSASECRKLYNERTYSALGYFDLYQRDGSNMVSVYREAGIDISGDFTQWAARGDFFYMPIHPRSFVLIDIIRRTFLGRYIDQQIHLEVADLYQSMADHLALMDRWPVYPEIAARHGFSGDLIWRNLPRRPEVDLQAFVEDEFNALATLDAGWRELPFVQRAAATLRPLTL